MNISHVLTSKAFQVAFGKRFLEAFGGLWLVFEPLGLFLPGKVPTGLGMYILLVLAGLILGLCLAWPRGIVSAEIPASEVTVTVRVGDLFTATDNVIIGVNDVFDTHIGDDIISNRSVQAQFTQKHFAGSVTAFDELLDRELKDISFTEDTLKTRGKSKRYPMGTTIEVLSPGTRYYLCAYCKMPPSLKAETTVCQILSSLEICWEKIRNSGQNSPISMPVIGSDFGRTGLTQTQLIQAIVLSFIASNKRQHIAPSLTIYVYHGNSNDVDFSALRMWLRGVLWA